MPRPTIQRSMQPLPFVGELAPVTFWEQPGGIDLLTPLSRLGTNKVPDAANWRVSDAQKYRTKLGTTKLGLSSATAIVGSIIAVDRAGIQYVVRVNTTKVQLLSGDDWLDLTGPTLSIDQNSFVEFTSWGGQLLFTDCTTGLYEIDFDTYTFTKIDAAPAGLHVTTFAGRVIISNIIGQPTRIQWCVRNNSEDWENVGSGFDDMLSAPGGVVDIQHGVYPINDQEALIIRASSIWVLNQTGNAVTPFNFFYRFSEGTDSPATIAKIPNQGVIMLGTNDVVLVTPGQVQSLGIPIRQALINNSAIRSAATAFYDARTFEYRIRVPLTTESTEYAVWRYHIPSGTWHKDTYPSAITRMSSGQFYLVDAVEDLTGTIEALTGTIESLGVGARIEGCLFTVAGTISAYEDAVATDVNSASDNVPISYVLESGLVLPSTIALVRTTIVGVALEYTSSASVTGQLAISTDGGTTWNNYGPSFTLGPTVVPALHYIHATVDRPQVMFRLTVAGSSDLELVAAYLFSQPGSPRVF